MRYWSRTVSIGVYRIVADPIVIRFKLHLPLYDAMSSSGQYRLDYNRRYDVIVSKSNIDFKKLKSKGYTITEEYDNSYGRNILVIDNEKDPDKLEWYFTNISDITVLYLDFRPKRNKRYKEYKRRLMSYKSSLCSSIDRSATIPEAVYVEKVASSAFDIDEISKGFLGKDPYNKAFTQYIAFGKSEAKKLLARMVRSTTRRSLENKDKQKQDNIENTIHTRNLVDYILSEITDDNTILEVYKN